MMKKLTIILNGLMISACASFFDHDATAGPPAAPTQLETKLDASKALPPAQIDKGLMLLERKLMGAWHGNGPCAGQLILRPDGSYERKKHGPAGNNSAGTWEVRWDALPPTLVLTCKTSDDASYIRKSEVKLIQLDNDALVYKFPDHTTLTRYSRMQK